MTRLDTYKKLDCTSTTSSSRTFLVQNVYNNLFFTLTEIDLNVLTEEQFSDLLLKLKILKTLNHPNVIELIEARFIDNGLLELVMEYGSNGNLYEYLRSQPRSEVDESQIQKWVLQLSLALKFIHDHKIVHGNLRLSNILLDSDNNVKISGFYMLVSNLERLNQGEFFDIDASKLAPEFRDKKESTFKTDMWQFGIIIYNISVGRSEFTEKEIERLT